MAENKGNLARSKVGLSRKDFLIRLNQRVTPRYGISVTDRMLRDWCENRLVPSPVKQALGHGKGSRAYWDAMTYRSACKICRLKSQGAKTVDSLRILLWLTGQYATLKDLRKSCISELKKLRSSRVMKPRSLVDPGNDNLSERSLKGLSKSLGSLDPQLAPVAGFDYNDREVTDMLALVKGDQTSSSFPSSLARAIIPAPMGSINIEEIVPIFRGIFGDPDEIENSGEDLLETAELKDFQKAREVIGQWMMGLRQRPNILEDAPRNQLNINPQLLVNASKALNQANYKVLMFLTLVSACTEMRGLQRSNGREFNRFIIGKYLQE